MALSLSPWAAVRRQDWQELLGELNRRIAPLDQALKQDAEQRPEVRLLMTHPGVGPVTANAFVVTLCEPTRFQTSKQVAAYPEGQARDPRGSHTIGVPKRSLTPPTSS